MKIIVHIGMPKTGSTALQDCLQASRAQLAECGLLYPRNPRGCRFNNHRLLAAQVLAFKNLPRHMTRRTGYTPANIDAKVREFLATLHRQIAIERPDGLILSAESLFRRLPPARYRDLRRTYRALGTERQFVAYLRKPSEQYLSLLQQDLRAAAGVRRPDPPEYRKVLKSYMACFGRAAVAARLFDRAHLERGDIVADFCTHALAGFGLDPAKLNTAGRPNQTLSAESMDILARYWGDFPAGPADADARAREATGLRHALIAAERRHGAPRPRLQPGIAERIDYASRDLVWVRDRFGVVFPGLDYDRLAAAPAADPAPSPASDWRLEDLVCIDRDLQAVILETLARSSWSAPGSGFVSAFDRKAWAGSLRRRP